MTGGREPRYRQEIGEKVDEVRTADMATEQDAEVEADIRRFRSGGGLPLDDGLIKQWVDDYREGRHPGGWWMTDEENAAYLRAAGRHEQTADEAQPYLDSHHADFAGGWVEHPGQEYHVAFARNLVKHREALEALVTYPEVLRFHEARFSLEELRSLSHRMSHDEAGLRADGINVVEAGANVVANRVEVGIVTADPDRAAEVLRGRYGDAVAIEYTRPAAHYADPIEWQCYETDSDGRALTIWYWANPFIELDHTDVEETGQEVRVGLFDRIPVGGLPLPATIRGVPVELTDPLGDRRVIDGKTGRVREPV